MIKEFAVEPAVLGTWNDFRHFGAMFGIPRGRYIAEYPKKKWAAMVLACLKDSLGSAPEAQRRLAAATEYFDLRDPARRRRAGVFATGRDWNPGKDWWHNVADSDAKRAFGGIIVTEMPEPHDRTYTATELWENDSPLNTPTGETPCLDEKTMAELAAPLCRISRMILLIDPYFAPARATCQNYLRYLVAAFHMPQVTLERFELHAKRRPDPQTLAMSPNYTQWRADCERHLPAILPASLALTLHLWDEQRNGGDDFHDRFALTENGGISLGRGMDVPDRHRGTGFANVQIVDESIRARNWQLFDAANPAFIQAGAPVRIVGTARS